MQDVFRKHFNDILLSHYAKIRSILAKEQSIYNTNENHEGKTTILTQTLVIT